MTLDLTKASRTAPDMLSMSFLRPRFSEGITKPIAKPYSSDSGINKEKEHDFNNESNSF